MKAALIIGSPKKNGSTTLLVSRIAQGMIDSGIEVNLYHPGQMNINYCKGCYKCLEIKECCQNDDMTILFSAIMKSDIILLASPSYWGDITSQMKTFIDRSLPLCDKTGKTIVPSGKIGISIAVRAGKSQNEAIHIINTFEHYMGHLGITPVESLMVTGVDCLEDMKENNDKLYEAYRLGFNIKLHENKSVS
jgi:multimeric flavodoxin WrbA